MGGEWGTEIWLLIIGSGVLALALPFVSIRLAARHQLLKELYLSSRPGRVLGNLVVLACVIGVVGMGAAVLSVAYSLMWGTVALCVSAALSVILFAVAYVRVARRSRCDLAEGGEDGGR